MESYDSCAKPDIVSYNNTVNFLDRLLTSMLKLILTSVISNTIRQAYFVKKYYTRLCLKVFFKTQTRVYQIYIDTDTFTNNLGRFMTSACVTINSNADT